MTPRDAQVAAIRAFGDAVNALDLPGMHHSAVIRAGQRLVDATINAERTRIRAELRDVLQP